MKTNNQTHALPLHLCGNRLYSSSFIANVALCAEWSSIILQMIICISFTDAQKDFPNRWNKIVKTTNTESTVNQNCELTWQTGVQTCCKSRWEHRTIITESESERVLLPNVDQVYNITKLLRYLVQNRINCNSELFMCFGKL